MIMMTKRSPRLLALAAAGALALSGCSLKDSIERALAEDDEEDYAGDTTSGGGSPPASAPGSILTPSLAGWEAIDGEPGVLTGVGHAELGLRVWFDDSLAPHLRPAAAAGHQPTVAGTWTGEWGALMDDVPATGDARVAVTIDAAGTRAVLHYDGVPGFGDLASEAMAVSDGAFRGTHRVTGVTGDFQVRGQFGGAGQAGLVGYVQGQDFLSGFYGERE